VSPAGIPAARAPSKGTESLDDSDLRQMLQWLLLMPNITTHSSSS